MRDELKGMAVEITMLKTMMYEATGTQKTELKAQINVKVRAYNKIKPFYNKKIAGV